MLALQTWAVKHAKRETNDRIVSGPNVNGCTQQKPTPAQQNGPSVSQETELLAVAELENQFVVAHHAELCSGQPFDVTAVATQSDNLLAQLFVLGLEAGDLGGQGLFLAIELQHVQNPAVTEQGDAENQSHQQQRPVMMTPPFRA